MKFLTKLIVPVSGFVLIACDPAYRIKRDNDFLNAAASFDCLKVAIEKVPGTKITSDKITNQPLACEKGKNARQIEYLADGEVILMTSCYEGNNLKSFSQAQSGLIGNLRPERVSIVITKMREIESSVEKRCDVKNLSAGMKNDCRRTQCGE